MQHTIVYLSTFYLSLQLIFPVSGLDSWTVRLEISIYYSNSQ